MQEEIDEGLQCGMPVVFPWEQAKPDFHTSYSHAVRVTHESTHWHPVRIILVRIVPWHVAPGCPTRDRVPSPSGLRTHGLSLLVSRIWPMHALLVASVISWICAIPLLLSPAIINARTSDSYISPDLWDHSIKSAESLKYVVGVLPVG